MQDAIPSRLPGEITDEAHSVLARFFRPQIHLVLDLDGALQPGRLARALRLLLDAEPVLGCDYESRWWRSRWRRLEAAVLDAAELLEVVEDGDREAVSQAFLGRALPPLAGPQLRALLHRGGGGDRLLIKVHHRVADAGGVKELGYRLAGIYRTLGDDPDHRPAPRLGDRSLWQAYRGVLPWRLPGLLRHALAELGPYAWPWRALAFSTGPWDGASPRTALAHLDAEVVAGMRRFGGPRGATLNDLLLAAAVRVFARERAWDGRQPLRVVSTADLRRHLPDERTGGLCNLSGFILIHVGRELGERFGDTLDHVLAATGRVKGPYLGLSWDLAGLLIALLPNGLGRALFRRAIRTEIRTDHMPLLVTNMGPIDDVALDRFGPPLGHAFLVCPPIREGVYGLGISGFRGTLTLSAAASPGTLPTETLERVFAGIERELGATREVGAPAESR